MSNETPSEQTDNPELRRLLVELERQVEEVNTGLSKIRGTVARISYAAFGSVAPSVGPAWGAAAFAGAPANRPPVRSTEAIEPAIAEPPAPIVTPVAIESPVASQPPATPHVARPPVPSVPAADPDPGFWASVAEGASWPRSHVNETPAAPVTHGQGEWAWTEPVNASPQDTAAALPDAQKAPMDAAQAPTTSSTGQPGVTNDVAGSPPASGEERRGSLMAGMPEMSGTLSGWPDEGAWSQGFEWGAAKENERPASPPASEPDAEAHVDISDIVAQVKAELEAARLAGNPLSLTAFGDDDSDFEESDVVEVATGTEALEATPEPSPEAVDVEASSMQVSEADDEARRAEVSRAVAEMRRQLEAGNFHDALQETSSESGSIWRAGPARSPEEPAKPVSDEDEREAVRRAVEAAREELGAPQKPAFRLAAPGSIPDWSHMQLEPSGPPVVVIKDADGRVELASVFETLNALSCGDGAALLNYTPHSVTVGLPATAKFPSQEQVAQAVEKVFGLSSRVESDGVRITVSIGERPKRKGEDAA